MPTDPRAGERAALGARCRELLKSETFQSAINAVDAEFQRAVLGTGPHESEKRDALMLEYHALKRIVARLRTWEEDGDLASRELSES